MVVSLIVELLFWLFAAATFLAGAIGLVLLLLPEQAPSLTRLRFKPLHSLMRRLDRVHTIERFFYRHHLPFGAFLALGGAYTLYVWVVLFNEERLIAHIALSRQMAAWLVEAGEWFLVGGNLAGILLGLAVLFRPSLLKRIEKYSNRWVPPEPPRGTLRLGLDGAVERYPRAAGLFISLGAWYVLTVFVMVFYRMV